MLEFVLICRPYTFWIDLRLLFNTSHDPILCVLVGSNFCPFSIIFGIFYHQIWSIWISFCRPHRVDSKYVYIIFNRSQIRQNQAKNPILIYIKIWKVRGTDLSSEIMAILRLDNQTVGQTSWRPCSQQAWDQRFSLPLDRARELEISIYWKDYRSLCAIKYLRLEDFIDYHLNGMTIHLEPQGILFAEIKFINPLIRPRPKLQRQKKLFTKRKGKDLLRAGNMNIDVLTWTRLIKRGMPNNCYDSTTTSPQSPLNLQLQQQMQQKQQADKEMGIMSQAILSPMSSGNESSPQTPVNGEKKSIAENADSSTTTASASSSSSSSSSNNSLVFSPSSVQMPASALSQQIPNQPQPRNKKISIFIQKISK